MKCLEHLGSVLWRETKVLLLLLLLLGSQRIIALAHLSSKSIYRFTQIFNGFQVADRYLKLSLNLAPLKPNGSVFSALRDLHMLSFSLFLPLWRLCCSSKRGMKTHAFWHLCYQTYIQIYMWTIKQYNKYNKLNICMSCTRSVLLSAAVAVTFALNSLYILPLLFVAVVVTVAVALTNCHKHSSELLPIIFHLQCGGVLCCAATE